MTLEQRFTAAVIKTQRAVGEQIDTYEARIWRKVAEQLLRERDAFAAALVLFKSLADNGVWLRPESTHEILAELNRSKQHDNNL